MVKNSVYTDTRMCVYTDIHTRREWVNNVNWWIWVKGIQEILYNFYIFCEILDYFKAVSLKKCKNICEAKSHHSVITRTKHLFIYTFFFLNESTQKSHALFFQVNIFWTSSNIVTTDFHFPIWCLHSVPLD